MFSAEIARIQFFLQLLLHTQCKLGKSQKNYWWNECSSSVLTYQCISVYTNNPPDSFWSIPAALGDKPGKKKSPILNHSQPCFSILATTSKLDENYPFLYFGRNAPPRQDIAGYWQYSSSMWWHIADVVVWQSMCGQDMHCGESCLVCIMAKGDTPLPSTSSSSPSSPSSYHQRKPSWDYFR